ncbi:MAG: DUF3150 domain-containing protein [Salinisphaeraceae bacterium]
MNTKVRKIDYGQPLVVIQFQARQISASRQIDRDQLNVDFSDLPKNVRAYLRQSFLPEGALRPFGKLFKRARDYLWGRALTTPLGFVISPDEAIEALATLEEIQAEVETEKGSFISKYRALIDKAEDEIREELAGYAQADEIIDAIRRVAPTEAYLEANIGFEFQALQVEPVQDFDPQYEALVKSGYESLRSGLFGKLVKEVSQDAYALQSDVSERVAETGQKKVRQKTVGRLRDLLEKIGNLAFIDSRASALYQLVEDAVDCLPVAAPLVNSDFRNFEEIVKGLADQRSIIDSVDNNRPLLMVSQAPAQTSLVGDGDDDATSVVPDSQPSADAANTGTDEGEKSPDTATESAVDAQEPSSSAAESEAATAAEVAAEATETSDEESRPSESTIVEEPASEESSIDEEGEAEEEELTLAF